MFGNRDINRLALHSTLREFAWGLAGVFFFAWLLRAGQTPAAAFLTVAAMFTLRLATRPLALMLIRTAGVRTSMIVGSVLYAGQFPLLARVDAGRWETLVLYVLVVALADVFYWTCYHAAFATAGDADTRGAQIGARGLFLVLADSAAPVIGGLLLSSLGPWAAFGAGSVVGLAAIAPLLLIRCPQPAVAPEHGFAEFTDGVRLFVTDGFIMTALVLPWGLIMFETFSRRFDAFGGLLGAASLAGALGGILLGRRIDAGHAGRAVWLNLAAMIMVVVLRTALADTPTGVVVAAIVANTFFGLYTPTLMTAVYNFAQASPSAIRFHYLAEAGWDVGAIAAAVAAAAAAAAGLPTTVTMVAALPVLALQAVLLRRRYAADQSGARWADEVT